MYPNPTHFSPEETYTAQIRRNFDEFSREKLSVDSIKVWEKQLADDKDTVTVPGEVWEKQLTDRDTVPGTRPISEVVDEMRQEQLQYIGILYYDNLQQRKRLFDNEGSVDTKQAFEDAMNSLRGNKLVSDILKADVRAAERCVLLPQRREHCETQVRECISHSQKSGLSKFSQMVSECKDGTTTK
jgi:hypothetical protein